MSVTVEREVLSGSTPAIWRGDCKVLPGGFHPTNNLRVGSVVYAGVPVEVDFDKFTAGICKTARVIAGGTTTEIRVGKGHLFAVGDVIGAVSVTDKCVTVTNIDTTNTTYDVIKVSKALTNTADDVLYEGKDLTTAQPLYTPNGVVCANVQVSELGIATVDVAYDALVLKNVLYTPLLTSWLNGFCLVNNPSIKFIKQ